MCTRPDDYCECVDCKKKKEPTIQVGKKYINKNGTGDIYECMYLSHSLAVFRTNGLDYPILKTTWEYYKEYKEPRTITRWVCVFENSVGLKDNTLQLFSSSYFFNSKEEACKWAVTTSHKLIEIVEFKYTEKVP